MIQNPMSDSISTPQRPRGLPALLLSTLNAQTRRPCVQHEGQQTAIGEARIIIPLHPLPLQSLRRKRSFARHLFRLYLVRRLIARQITAVAVEYPHRLEAAHSPGPSLVGRRRTHLASGRPIIECTCSSFRLGNPVTPCSVTHPGSASLDQDRPAYTNAPTRGYSLAAEQTSHRWRRTRSALR